MQVVRDPGGPVRVEGIGPIVGFTKGRDCTFIHCLELVLEAAGRPIGYDELMGVSGLAFRAQFRVDRWDVGNPDPLVGEDCLPALFAAVGWDYEIRVVRQDELAEADYLQRSIRESIDRRMPVLAANIIPPEDWGIIVGYLRDRLWLCRSYNGEAQRSDTPARGWPTAVVFLTTRKPRPPPAQIHLDSLRRAGDLYDQRKTGSHAVGRKAFDYWCQALLAPSDAKYVHANFWTYIGLIDARAAAVRYLRSIADEFGSRRIHVLMAADHYDREVRLLLRGLGDVPSANLYPDAPPPAEMRRLQADTLRECQAIEDRAIEALKRAL